ncbi:eukaryotic translation initiation factor 3 subunit A-like [Cynara cardunculus var. scolymus]|uniref:eukaryotic translation initiation factor 3 subunit A-like n=1 Tax=Cynara cardunculus var. scolymus TaxID=59895 RepID=UPI000D626455|nr:eukaryotic translation initiation factor 3 subunit A-like [Cynara cardunculus var. scolymus]
MATFAKPENALKRAEELINVGQKQDALQVLHDLITSRRYRAWQKTHEKIMLKYIELCVDMRRGRFAKDGLIQYRIICQQVNINSLEEVIKHFMDLSTKRAELARSQAQALEEALDVDDLEADKRPEDLMLSYVSGEKGKERSDRELVTPWFKFLWETYRTVLEILRNNSKLMALYADTAHRAFQFCKQYKRTTEFRRLCEIIRNHLANLNKYRDQRDRPDLSSPESLHFYLDTRFEQLKVATELELWQEAFRSVEDIYGLTSMVKKMPKSSLMAVYYAKLTEIFWISSSHLYHAYAWFKLFQLQKSFNKNLSQKDLQLIASSVLLAALSAPPYDHMKTASHLKLEHEKERNIMMYNLIGFNIDVKPETGEVLSRSTLLMDLVSKGVMTYVTQEVKDLYHLLENEFLPLDLASKVQPLLTKISKLGGKLSSASSVPEVQLSQYIPALEKVATLRLLQQVSHVYQTMKVETLTKMVPFFDFSAVERILVDAVKHKFVAIKVDHLKGAIIFGDLGFESDHLQNHLGVLGTNLTKSRLMINPSPSRVSKLSDMLPSLAEIIDKEHKRLLARKTIIEKRKEDQERQLIEMEREEETKRLKQQKKAEEAEQMRLATEFQERKNQRILREIEEREREEAQALLNDVEKRIKKKGKKPIIEGEKVTKQTLMELALQEQVRERQEMEKKLQKLIKTMDHFERAKREEAAPLIEAAYERRLGEEKLHHERQQQLEVELSRGRHDGDVKEKYRLHRVMEHKMQFQERVMKCRRGEYDRMRSEREERLSQVLQARKEEREIKRKMLYWVRTEEERLKKLHEEEEARKREELERRKKEEAERRAKLDEIAEKQRQREQELEERERLRKEAILRGTPIDMPARPSEILGAGSIAPAAAPAPALAAAGSGSSGGKYVPRFRRSEPSGQAPPPPAESDRWGAGKKDDRGAPTSDKWRPSATSGSKTWSSSRFSR